MQTNVYANDLEIACKSEGSDAKSIAPGADPCWSPPAPPAGPVVIPYPNTVFGKDITNGTKTIFICGKEVAIEDTSYFATSTGNEPATQAFAKGVATGVITGKGYFKSWSFDVIFEGLGVARHTDLVTHNHGSMPSNTPVFPYISRGWFSHDCSKEEKRIERACKSEKEHSESKKDLKKHSKLSALLKLKRNGKSGVGRRGKDGHHWTDDHCDGLHISLDTMEKAKEYAQQMEEAFKSLPNELNILGALKSELQNIAVNAGTKAAAKWGAKAGLKQLAGSEVPIAGNIVMGIWSAVDAVSAIGDVGEIKTVATEALEQLDVLKNKLTDLQNVAKEFENFSKLSPEEKLKKAQQIATEGQDALATLNECTRARKCNLVPYSSDGVGGPFGSKQSKVESAKNGGCCPGQTGHHLIPEESIKDSCPNYDHGAAPTVCVEGTSQNMGSHKRIHQALAVEHEKLAMKGKVASDGSMSMNDALDAAANSHKEAFPLSQCSKKCIRAQLDAYYKACRGARPKMVNDQAKKTLPGNDNSR